MRSRGLPYQNIAKKLSEQGLRTRTTNQPISHNVIARMLKNKFYIGIMTCDGKQYTHRYPQIDFQREFLINANSLLNNGIPPNPKLNTIAKCIPSRVLSDAGFAVASFLRLMPATMYTSNVLMLPAKISNTAEALAIAKHIKSLSEPCHANPSGSDTSRQASAE